MCTCAPQAVALRFVLRGTVAVFVVPARRGQLILFSFDLSDTLSFSGEPEGRNAARSLLHSPGAPANLPSLCPPPPTPSTCPPSSRSFACCFWLCCPQTSCATQERLRAQAAEDHEEERLRRERQREEQARDREANMAAVEVEFSPEDRNAALLTLGKVALSYHDQR